MRRMQLALTPLIGNERIDEVEQSSLSCGRESRARGWNDQNSRSSSVIFPLRVSDDFGQRAPVAIHLCSIATSASSSGASGGIFSSACLPATACHIKLFAGSPGTTAGPDTPPLATAAAESKRRPPSALRRWHSKQRLESSGRTLFSSTHRLPPAGPSRIERTK